MDSYTSYVVKSFNIWAAEIFPLEQTYKFKVKSSRNWRKTLNKRLHKNESLEYAVPETYQQLLTRIKSATSCKKQIFCIVTKVDNKLTISSFISTCIDLENFQPVPILFIKIGDRFSNYRIKNVCKVDASKKWIPVPQVNMKIAQNVKMQHYFCEICASKH